MSNEANEATRDYFTQSTFTQSTVTQNTLNVPVRLRRRTAAHKAMVSVILSALMILAAACDESGGGSGDGGQSAEAALITQPVDLPPGQTEAELAWEPSVGPVTGYMVFASRNGSTFDFEANASESSAMISGEPGDEVSIVVVALSENGSLSDASPPSAPVRFHAETPSDTVAATDRVIDPASTAIAFTNEQVTNKTIAFGLQPGRTIVSAHPQMATESVRLYPAARVTNGVVTSAIIVPRDKPNRHRPRAKEDSSSCILISGMRGIQFPSTSDSIKKIAHIAMCACFFVLSA